MEKSRILEAIEMIAQEKNIKKSIILNAIKVGIIKVYEKKMGEDQDLDVVIDKATGEINVWRKLEEHTPEMYKEDIENGLTVVYREDEDAYYENITSDKYNRVAIMSAAQLIKQQLRIAEKEAIVAEYMPSQGEIMYGEVAQVSPNHLLVKINQTLAYIPILKLISNERYYIGDPITFLAEKISNSTTDAQIQGTRISQAFLEKLMELEIPEIMEEVIRIKSIARRPGFRSKVAIACDLANIDPVGACIGPRGTRINAISNQLNNERIDVCLWEPDIERFVVNAMSPAKVIQIALKQTPSTKTITNDEGEEEKINFMFNEAFVVVPDEQYSLAIGSRSRNCQLTSQLTKCNITVVGYTQALNAGVNITWNGNLTPDSLVELKNRLSNRNFTNTSSSTPPDSTNAVAMKKLQDELAENEATA